MRLPLRLVASSRRLTRDRRSSVMVEIAVCLPIFLFLLFFVFELAFDAFVQATVEATLQTTAQQIQVGSDTAATASNFLTNYVCPNDGGLLNCSNLYIRVQNYSPTACSDFYTATTGAPPVSGGAVGLGYYQGTVAGTGSNIGSTACSTNSATAFCNPLPSQQIILSAVYLAPSFLQGLLPNAAYSYNNKTYHVAFATICFETENFSVIGTEAAPCPASA